MSQLDELQSRITAALDRISQGLEEMSAGGGPGAEELDSLKQQLEDEKLASAQLEERLKRMKDKLDEARAELEAAGDGQRAEMQKLDNELQSLRRANQHLRENNKALREANAAGVAEPHLINKAMLAELEGLRAARNVDRAEAEAVMAELTRMIENAGSGDAPEETEDA